MTLREWLKSRRMRQHEFARLSGLSKSTVNNLVRGRVRPSADVAHKVERATHGEVRVADLLGGGGETAERADVAKLAADAEALAARLRQIAAMDSGNQFKEESQ